MLKSSSAFPAFLAYFREQDYALKCDLYTYNFGYSITRSTEPMKRQHKNFSFFKTFVIMVYHRSEENLLPAKISNFCQPAAITFGVKLN